jgi:hypothetical protein
MWNPLASLPPSNAGALAGYAPAATTTGTQTNPGFPTGPQGASGGSTPPAHAPRPDWNMLRDQRFAQNVLGRHPGATMFPGLFDDPNFGSNLHDLRDDPRRHDFAGWRDQFQTSMTNWQQALQDYIAGGRVGAQPQPNFQSPLFTYLTTGQMPQSQSGF